MEKELKIAELAALWNVSVTATWARVNKDGLKTFKKVDETGKMVTFVHVSENDINKYLKTVINGNNNRYYKDMLSNNNGSKVEEDVVDVEYSRVVANNNGELLEIIKTVNNDFNERLAMFYDGYNEQLLTINNNYNEHLQRLTDELITCKQKELLLEDKAGREGLYLQQIQELEVDKKGLLKVVYGLIIFIVLLLIFITGVIGYNYAVNNVVKDVDNNIINQGLKELIQEETNPFFKQ